MGVKKKKNGESVQNGGIKPHHETNGSLKETFPDPFAVTWAEKYSAGFEKVWSKIPKFLGAFIVTSAICTMGLGISGKKTLSSIIISYLLHLCITSYLYVIYINFSSKINHDVSKRVLLSYYNKID